MWSEISLNHQTLPKGYRFMCSMDFQRNRNKMLALVKLSLVLTVVPVAVGLLLVPVKPSWELMKSRWWSWFALGAALILYIPLHELVHGISMYLLTGVRPKYGVKLPYAYCGSTAWFDRRSHVITALAPVVFFGVLLQVAIALTPPEWFWPLWIIQISNLSGSAGDIYCAWALMRMEGDILIQDTGVNMRIYIAPPRDS